MIESGLWLIYLIFQYLFSVDLSLDLCFLACSSEEKEMNPLKEFCIWDFQFLQWVARIICRPWFRHYWVFVRMSCRLLIRKCSHHIWCRCNSEGLGIRAPLDGRRDWDELADLWVEAKNEKEGTILGNWWNYSFDVFLFRLSSWVFQHKNQVLF